MLITSNQSLTTTPTPKKIQFMPITLEPDEMKSTINELFQKQSATPTDSTKYSIETILIAKFGVTSTVKVFQDQTDHTIFAATISTNSLFSNNTDNDFMIYISTAANSKNHRIEYMIKSTPEHHKPDIEQIKKYILLKNITSSGNAKIVTPQLIKEAIHTKYPKTQGYININEEYSEKAHLIRVQLGNDTILFKLTDGDQLQEVNNNEYILAGYGLNGGVKGSKHTKGSKEEEQPQEISGQPYQIKKLLAENEKAMRKSVAKINSLDTTDRFDDFEKIITKFCNSIGVSKKPRTGSSHNHKWALPTGDLINIQPRDETDIHQYQLDQVKDYINGYKSEYDKQHNTIIKKPPSKNKIRTYSTRPSHNKSGKRKNSNIYISYEDASDNGIGNEILPELGAPKQITQPEGTIASAEVTKHNQAIDLNRIATNHLEGIGVAKNKEEAFKYYKMANEADPEDIDFNNNLFYCYLKSIGVDINNEQNQKNAYLLSSKACNIAPTNVRAKYNLAICFLNGIGVAKNEKEAFKLLLDAHHLDPKNIIVMNTLAYCYKDGIGCEINDDEAFKLLLNAHNLDPKNIIVMNTLANYYLNGIVVDINDEQIQKEVYELCSKACKIAPTNSRAKYNLAICYLDGIGVAKNEKEAFKLLNEAYTLDPTNARVISDVGICYKNGIGVEKNKTEAFRFSQMAYLAAPNDINFINDFSLHYLNGSGVDMSKQQNQQYAYTLCNDAYTIDPNNAMANNNLAICFLKGIGVAKDLTNALKFLEFAHLADRKNIYFMESLFNRYTEMGRKVEAFNVLQKIKEAHPDNVTNLCNLAYYYEKGIGVAKNEKEAFDLYKKIDSICPNHFNTLVQLANCYKNGIGVEKNKEQEVSYLNKVFVLLEDAIYSYNGKPDENNQFISFKIRFKYLSALTQTDETNKKKHAMLSGFIQSPSKTTIGSTSYNLACYYKLNNNVSECQKWLVKAQSNNHPIPEILKSLLPKAPGIIEVI